VPLVQLLLDQGADIDAADAADGMTPLMAAVQACNYLVARHLLERGASWGPGDYGQPDCDPFYRACWIRDVDLIRLFIEKGAVERYNLEAAQEARVGNWKEGLVKGLHAVAQAGDAALLRAMLKIGGKLLRQEMMEWERNLGASTPYAYGRFDREKREEEKRTLRAMSALMESWRTFLTVPGDGPTCALGDTQGPRLTTPPNALGYQLIMACDQARGDEVRDLLARDAEATWEEKSTLRTPLMSAARAGSVTCVRLLLQRLREQGRWDALDHRDVLGRTALWHACFERHADVVELLMAHGADADTDCDVAVTQQASSLMNSKDWWVWRGDRERSLAYQGKSPLEVAEMRHCVCLKAIKVN
jgi:ankyrin repeat protein